jgi:hypothetical protein
VLAHQQQAWVPTKGSREQKEWASATVLLQAVVLVPLLLPLLLVSLVVPPAVLGLL